MFRTVRVRVPQANIIITSRKYRQMETKVTYVHKKIIIYKIKNNNKTEISISPY